MHPLPLLPNPTPPLHNRNQLLRRPHGKHILPGPTILPLRRRVQYPLERLPSPLTFPKRDWNLQRDAAASCAALGADAEERGDGVDGEGEVEDRIEREVGGGWGAGE